MKVLVSIALVCALAGCSTYQAHSNLATPYAPTDPSKVQILYAPPQRAYTSIGIVSANRYKPGWTDPTISDAVPQLQAAGAQIGADAVIVRADRSNDDRHIVVEGEAIKFSDTKSQH
ncbi:hypothetical protein [Luteibacter sp. Lutesp34]|uniref:hypothetical protein n=1 Tax=Luteibacter sp. Lutesp34 TaxID=3243030 RepID=UPI0039B6B663